MVVRLKHENVYHMSTLFHQFCFVLNGFVMISDLITITKTKIY